MSAHTSDDLIKEVRYRGMFPDASKGSYSAENILLMASQELRMKLVPMILSVREKYYETYVDYPMISGISIYALPERAIGGMASSVQYIVNQSVTKLSNLEPISQRTTQTGLYPKGFWFENDHVVIYPVPNASQGTIRVRYFQRPSLLVKTLDCAQIVEIDAADMWAKVRSYPSSWSSGISVDFVSNTVPYTPYGIDYAVHTITAADGSSETKIQFTSWPTNKDGVGAVAVGDWIATAGYTPIPELMNEFFPILAQRTVVKLLEASGDREGAQIAAEMAKEMVYDATKLITPREQFGLKKCVSGWRQW